MKQNETMANRAGDSRHRTGGLTAAVATRIAQFTIAPHFVVGNFSFQKMAMVRDLRELLDALVQHDIVAAMARDPGASAALRMAGTGEQLPDVDAVPPDQEVLVLDADSTQQRAVGHALLGRNGVIGAPQGQEESDHRESPLRRGEARRARGSPQPFGEQGARASVP
jgi:hypothetical protein